MRIDCSNNPDYKKDHVAITCIGDHGDGWIRLGYTGLRASHIAEDNLNIIGVDLI